MMGSKRQEGTKTTRPDGRATRSRRAGEDRYKALVEQLPVGVYRTTPDGMIVEANSVLARMLGYKKPQALFNRNVRDFYVSGKDRARHIENLALKPVYLEYELKRADGRRFWVRDYSRGIKGPDGAFLHFDGVLIDITEIKTADRKLQLALRQLRQSNEKNESLSLTDDLTGLYNRRGFFTFGLQQMKFAKRLKKYSYLVFLDIDNLKEINDSYGHAAGDLLLQGVAAILKSTLRESDVIGRIGGDEFAVLAMRSKGLGERTLLARIDESVQAFRLKKYRGLRLSVSMGLVSVDPQKYRQLDDFLAHADFLMYQQKRRKEKQGNSA